MVDTEKDFYDEESVTEKIDAPTGDSNATARYVHEASLAVTS